jgi:phage head maturation protease
MSISLDVEYRSTPSPVEFRSGGGKRRVGGYAAVFGATSKDLGGFREIVEPSAFNKAKATATPTWFAGLTIHTFSAVRAEKRWR